MLLDLTSEQELLGATTARFIDDVFPLIVMRSRVADDSGLPPGYLERGADLGWYSLLVPEALGGGSVSGRGLLDAVVVAETRGACVQPGPFAAMNVAAFALGRAGSHRQRAEVLPSLIAGREVATWAMAAPRGRGPADPDVTAVADAGGGYRLSGTRRFVPDVQIARWILIDASIDRGLVQFLVDVESPGVHVSALESLDFSTRAGNLTLDGVAVSADDVVGSAASAPSDIEAQLDVAAVLNVAETVGAMDRLFDMTVRYAGQRIAFGRPIGSFQAVKHQLADLSLQLEMSKAASDVAARAVAAGNGSALASVAKAFVGDASVDISQGCFQVHGGIGYTWEHDLHLYLRRASFNRVLFGSPEWHHERILRLAGV